MRVNQNTPPLPSRAAIQLVKKEAKLKWMLQLGGRWDGKGPHPRRRLGLAEVLLNKPSGGSKRSPMAAMNTPGLPPPQDRTPKGPRDTGFLTHKAGPHLLPMGNIWNRLLLKTQGGGVEGVRPGPPPPRGALNGGGVYPHVPVPPLTTSRGSTRVGGGRWGGGEGDRGACGPRGSSRRIRSGCWGSRTRWGGCPGGWCT